MNREKVARRLHRALEIHGEPMQQRVVTVSAIAGLTLFGVLAGVQKACSQAPGRPVRAAVSSTNPTGGTVNNSVAADAAYNSRAGEGRNATPALDAPVQEGMSPGSGEFGRPNPGRPAYEDPEFQGSAGAQGPRSQGQGRTRAQGQAQAQSQGQAQNQNGAQSDDGEAEGGQDQGADEDVLTVADGFFFDNYTSGSGFGVYGGEPVTSGQGQQLVLPTAGVNSRNLGLPVLPNQPVGPGQPGQPQDPSID